MTQGPAADGDPPLAMQEQFWNDWNMSHLASAERDSFQLAQRDTASAVARRLVESLPHGRPIRILDFGCGTGWLGASLTSFGSVTGVDLSSAAIEQGRREFPEITLVAGHFLEADLVGPFDLVVSADVIAHVADQQAYVDRASSLLGPGGIFLLMTQNGFVWRRSSYLRPQGEHQIRQWPSLARIRAMLDQSDLRISRVSSFEPAGDRGVLRVLNNRWPRRAFKLVGLGQQWRQLLESARLGRELVIEAQRPDTDLEHGH